MVQATDLKGRVKRYMVSSGQVGAFSDSIKQSLSEAKALFELAPDEYVDTGRLPNSVVSLSTLVDYLKTIKSELENRDNSVENKDWDVAKSGKLRLYKLFVCNIHALSSYVTRGNPAYNVTSSIFADAARTHGKANPPTGLSEKGKTMWDKTYGDNQPRTAASMKTLVYLCTLTQNAQQTPQTPIVPPPEPTVNSESSVVDTNSAANDVEDENKNNNASADDAENTSDDIDGLLDDLQKTFNDDSSVAENNLAVE
jgi:hypothetical protein